MEYSIASGILVFMYRSIVCTFMFNLARLTQSTLLVASLCDDRKLYTQTCTKQRGIVVSHMHTHRYIICFHLHLLYLFV